MATGGMTNRGKKLVLGWVFQGVALPSNFYVALVTNASAPGPLTNVLSDLTQIATGNGYTNGGIQLSLNGTDFPTLTEDDTNNLGSITIRDLVWTAGGTFPSSGGGARYAVLTDDNATVNNRQVVAWFDLVSPQTRTSGQTLVISSATVRILEP